MGSLCRLLFVAVFCGTFAATAEEPVEVYSGPQTGEALTPLRAQVVSGDDAGATIDFVERAEGKPLLLVIVNGANRPAAGLTRALMNYAEMQGDQLFAGVVYLDGDLTAAERYLHQAVSWWGVGRPVGISVDGAEGPGAWGLNRNVNLTIIVAEQNEVQANFALVQPSLTDGPKILAEVNKLVEGRIPTTAEMSFLSMPTRKPGNANWQPAPSDVDLRRLICDALASADDDAANTAAAAVDDYVGDDEKRRVMLGAAASAMLNRKSYTEIRDVPIVSHLRRWREDYGDPEPRRRGKQD